MKTIAIMACCDTKYHEVRYVREKISAIGCVPLVLDISTGGDVPIKADIPREQIVTTGGYTWEAIRSAPKDEALSKMSQCAARVLTELREKGSIDAVLGMGGLQNTVVCTAAMQTLPLGFPKLMVSTIASGNRYFNDVVGDSDIAAMPSIVDFAGMNAVAEVILSNACAAVVGMANYGGGLIREVAGWRVGTTLMGITNDTVMHAANLILEAGMELISFHSTGVGGRTMEKMIAQGSINAVMDLTLHEMTPEYFGGLGYGGGANNRLCAGAQKGIPMVVCPGGIDFICLRPGELFEDEEKRGYNWHNAALTHTKLYEHEILSITETIAKRLNVSTGKVTVLLPMGGLRTMSRPGEFFNKPETIQKMKGILETTLKPDIVLKCFDLNFMDKEFGEIAAKEMLALLQTGN
ncbi:Tm-1-like ATP-binding domain-containing protein [Treponema primitia]|uniref:Tm-1-like ATP-binding domain-containing protein n=1 Tax=Treponema primitia TaxID=88058 RepID=UPI0039813155